LILATHGVTEQQAVQH
jgi:hypothetical protein